jgi:hypothetical protein
MIQILRNGRFPGGFDAGKKISCRANAAGRQDLARYADASNRWSRFERECGTPLKNRGRSVPASGDPICFAGRGLIGVRPGGAFHPRAACRGLTAGPRRSADRGQIVC